MTLVKFKKPGNSFPTIFDEFMKDFWTDIPGDSGSAGFLPSTNVWEEDNKYNIELSAPGFNKEDIKVEVGNKVMTISGEHKAENEKEEKNYTRKEFSYGSFKRTFTLPENVNADNINAKYENGILKLAIPKKETEVKAAKQIEVS